MLVTRCLGLLEADQGGLLAEAAAADVQTVLADEAAAGAAHTAVEEDTGSRGCGGTGM